MLENGLASRTIEAYIIECDTWYHHQWCQQCVLRWNLIIFKVVMSNYLCRHHHENKCILQDFLMLIDSFYFSTARFKLSILQSPNMAPNAVLGGLGNRKWNRFLVAVATYLRLFPTLQFLFNLDTPKTELRPFKYRDDLDLWSVILKMCLGGAVLYHFIISLYSISD